MSGGFDTLYTSALMGIGVLASPMGQEMQQKAYDDLLSHYETPEKAFQFTVDEEKSRYITAFTKEVLRFYPPLKILPPRQTMKDFEYRGARIPKGVLIYLNSQAINRGHLPAPMLTQHADVAEQTLLPMVPMPMFFGQNDGLRKNPIMYHRPCTHSVLVLASARVSTSHTGSFTLSMPEAFLHSRSKKAR